MKNKQHGIISPGPAAVARAVRTLMVDRQLGPGDRLPTHDELSRQLGVSLRRIREGLGILEHQGWICTRRKAGTLVTLPTAEALADPIGWQLDRAGCRFADLVRARASMESAVAAEAARCRRSRDLLMMLDAIERMEESFAEPPGAEADDEAFHQAVLAATGNPALHFFGQLISHQFERKQAEQLVSSPRGLRVTLTDHRAIYQAIERHDVASARQRMHKHVLRQLKEKRLKSTVRKKATPSAAGKR